MSGRTLLVTGASSKVGDALIRKIAGNYDTVFAHYNRGEEAVRALCESVKSDADLCSGGHDGESLRTVRIIPVQADFADEESTRAMIDGIRGSGHTPSHVVHLSAVRASWKKFAKFSWEDYRAELDADLRPAVLLAQAFVPEMAKQKYGRFVFMLTAFTCGADPKYMSPYITAKYALLGLMKNLAAEYAEKNVHFHAVSPEMMDTPFVENVPETARRLAAEASPSGVLLSPETAAERIAFLLSKEADDRNGENLYIR